jgi:hypothetical protein
MGKLWSPSEKKKLEDNWETSSREQLETIMEGRTYEAILKMGERMRLPSRANTWTQREEEILLSNADLTATELSALLPRRTVKAILNKLFRMGIIREEPEAIQLPLKDKILDVLQSSEMPLEMDTLKARSVTTAITSEVERVIRELERDGYDIKKITSGETDYYILVRFAGTRRDMQYRILGQIETPLILSSDWHIGSKGFSPQIMQQMVNDTRDMGIRDVLMVGDILQGKGVHRLELQDLIEPDIQSQVDMGVRELRKFPSSVKFHMTLGGHEEKFKGKIDIGFDGLEMVSRRVPNSYYYGSVANLMLDDQYTVCAMHSSGGLTMSTSYRAETIWRELVQRPDILTIGHTHQMMLLPKAGGRLLAICGTLQRENAFLLWKGHTAQLGYIILEEYSRDGWKATCRTLQTY